MTGLQSIDFDFVKKHVAEFIETRLQRDKVTGLSLALVDDEKIAWATGFGWADKKKGAVSTPETVYKVGSITKLFTATAIMQLVELGKIKLDNPVRVYLPEFSYKAHFPIEREITVRQLMTHHSGLPCDNRKGLFCFSFDSGDSFKNSLDYLREHYACYPPDYIFSYSNLATDLLGIIIERVSGLDYAKYVANHILEPLDMKNSYIQSRETEDFPVSKAYSKGKEVRDPFLRDTPAGGLNASVLDLANFIKMMLAEGQFAQQQVLKPESVGRMFTPQNSEIPLDLGLEIGLNWILTRPALSPHKVVWHDGGGINFFSMLVILPEHRLGVIISTNSQTGYSLISDAADLVLKLTLQSKGAETVNKTEVKTPLPNLDSFVGKFATAKGLISIERRGAQLKATVSGRKLDMLPNRDGWFSLRLRLLGIPIKVKQLEQLRFTVKGIGGKKVLAAEQNGVAVALGNEYTALDIPAVWRKRVGTYKVMDGETDTIERLKLGFDQGVLTLRAKVRKVGELSFVLKPLSEDKALLLGLGRYAQETLCIKPEAGGEVLEVLGLRFSKRLS